MVASRTHEEGCISRRGARHRREPAVLTVLERVGDPQRRGPRRPIWTDRTPPRPLSRLPPGCAEGCATTLDVITRPEQFPGLAIACALLLAAGCFSPSLPDDLSCGPLGECPEGQRCEPFGSVCVPASLPEVVAMRF